MMTANHSLPTLALAAFLVAGCSKPQAPNAKDATDAAPQQAQAKSSSARELRTVENLPIDRFDEYPAGSQPPAPWVLEKADAPGVSVTLESTAESDFPKNKVTGKGVLLRDTSEEAGDGAGFSMSFTPPPDGDIYLGFDFRLGETAQETEGPKLYVELADPNGDGLTIRLSTDHGVIIEEEGGRQAWLRKPLTAGMWYHLGVTVGADRMARVVMFDNGNKKKAIPLGTVKLLAAQAPVKLSFASDGGDKRQGTWAVDNVMMAGQVSADRTAWLPFKQLPYETLLKEKRKAFSYYYPIYSARWTSDDPGLSWYALTTLNPSVAVDPRRTDAGTKIFYFPLPRPTQIEGLTDEEEKIRAAEDEVRLAIAMGLDGFVVDFFTYPSNRGGMKFFNTISFAMVEAAARVNPNFKIIPAIYVSKDGKYSDSDVFTRLNEMPAVMRTEDGRMLFSKWRPEEKPAEFWKQEMADLEKRGIRTAFVAQFNSTDHIEEFAPFSYAMSHWGPRSPGRYGWMDKARPHTKILSAPIASHDIRSRGQIYWEAANFDTVRDTWKYAIQDKADWVILNTWSDYSEQAMAPSTSIGFAVHDINTYYLQWFKTGQQPEITKDVLYYSYRIHRTELEPKHGHIWKLVQQWGGHEMTPHNEIELLAFLTQPGELVVKAGGKEHRQQAGAGITSFKVPLPSGETFLPEFALVRDGKTVLDGQGNHVVLDEVEYPNMLYHSGVIAAP